MPRCWERVSPDFSRLFPLTTSGALGSTLTCPQKGDVTPKPARSPAGSGGVSGEGKLHPTVSRRQPARTWGPCAGGQQIWAGPPLPSPGARRGPDPDSQAGAPPSPPPRRPFLPRPRPARQHQTRRPRRTCSRSCALPARDACVPLPARALNKLASNTHGSASCNPPTPPRGPAEI